MELTFSGSRFELRPYIVSDPAKPLRRLAAPTPPSPSGSVRRRLRFDAGPACARWLRSRLIPGLRPRGSPGV